MKITRLLGVIGLEEYNNCGLLRSMVVSKEFRNKKVASLLVQGLERYAATLDIDYMYLLTETAQEYFEKKGYEIITRDEVPTAIQTSSEFSRVCPVTAIVMKKQLVQL